MQFICALLCSIKFPVIGKINCLDVRTYRSVDSVIGIRPQSKGELLHPYCRALHLASCRAAWRWACQRAIWGRSCAYSAVFRQLPLSCSLLSQGSSPGRVHVEATGNEVFLLARTFWIKQKLLQYLNVNAPDWRRGGSPWSFETPSEGKTKRSAGWSKRDTILPTTHYFCWWLKYTKFKRSFSCLAD